MVPTQPVAFRPRRLGHVNLFVSSVDRSQFFYTDVCGFAQVFAEPEILAVFLGNGNTHHDLALMGAATHARVGRDGHVQVAADRGTTAGLNHLGFELDTEEHLVDALERARLQGVPIHRVVDHQISHSVYLFDPDGHYIELYADVTIDWRGLYSRSEGQLVTGSWDPSSGTASAEPMFDPDPDITVVTGALVHPRRVWGAVLTVSELDRSVEFYEDVIGLDLQDRTDDTAVLGGTIGAGDLTLRHAGRDERPGLHLVRVEVEAEEVAAAIERLAAAGLTPHHSPLEQVSGRSVGFVLRDPDGMMLEFSALPG